MLVYLMVRERAADEDKGLEDFKRAMIASHPEMATEIQEDFASAKSGEWAPPMDEEEMDAQPMDANSLEEALEQMRRLGVGLQG